MGCIPGKLSLCSTKKAKRKESEAESEGDGNTGGRRSFKPTEGLRAIIPIIQNASLLAQATISTSQTNFFQMLDEKIEQGRELDSQEEKAERNARMDRVVKEWENFLETRPTPQQMYNSCHLYTPTPPSPSPRSIARSNRPAPKTTQIKLDRNFSKDSLDTYSICSDTGNRLVPRKEDDGNSSDDSAISIKIHNSKELILPEQISRHSSTDQVSLIEDNSEPHSCPSHFQVNEDILKEHPSASICPPKVIVTPTEAYDGCSKRKDIPETVPEAEKPAAISSDVVTSERSLEDTPELAVKGPSGSYKDLHLDQRASLEVNGALQGNVISSLKESKKKITLCANKDSEVQNIILETRSSDAILETTRSTNAGSVQQPEMLPRKNSGKFCPGRFKRDNKRRRSYPPGGVVILSSRPGKKINGAPPLNMLNGTVVTSNRLLFTTKRSLTGRRSSYGDSVPLRVK